MLAHLGDGHGRWMWAYLQYGHHRAKIVYFTLAWIRTLFCTFVKFLKNIEWQLAEKFCV